MSLNTIGENMWAVIGVALENYEKGGRKKTNSISLKIQKQTYSCKHFLAFTSSNPRELFRIVSPFYVNTILHWAIGCIINIFSFFEREVYLPGGVKSPSLYTTNFEGYRESMWTDVFTTLDLLFLRVPVLKIICLPKFDYYFFPMGKRWVQRK